MLPSVGASTQHETNVAFELLLNVSAFSQFIELSVTDNLAYDFEMQATPSGGNSEEVCVDIVQTFSLTAARSFRPFAKLIPNRFFRMGLQ